MRVVRALPTRGPMQRVVACTVAMCSDVFVHNLDQWRSSDSSTDINITIFNFKEGQLTLLTHVLHRAPSAPPRPGSGGWRILFDRAARSRDCTYVVTVVINRDVAGKDARRIRHLTASQGSRASERVREQRSSF